MQTSEHTLQRGPGPAPNGNVPANERTTRPQKPGTYQTPHARGRDANRPSKGGEADPSHDSPPTPTPGQPHEPEGWQAAGATSLRTALAAVAHQASLPLNTAAATQPQGHAMGPPQLHARQQPPQPTSLNPSAPPFRGPSPPSGCASLEQLESRALGHADASGLRDVVSRMRSAMRARDALDTQLLGEVDHLVQEAERYGEVQEERKKALADAADAHVALHAAQAQVAAATQLEASLRSDLSLKEGALRSKEDQARKLEAELSEVRRRLAASQKESAKHASTSQDLQAQLSQLQEEHQRLQEAYEEQESSHQAHVASLTEQLEAARSEAAQAQMAHSFMYGGNGGSPVGYGVPLPGPPPPLGTLIGEGLMGGMAMQGLHGNGMGAIPALGLQMPPFPPPFPAKPAPPGFSAAQPHVPPGPLAHGDAGDTQPADGSLLHVHKLFSLILEMLPDDAARALHWGPAQDAELDKRIGDAGSAGTWLSTYAPLLHCTHPVQAVMRTGRVKQRADGACYREGPPHFPDTAADTGTAGADTAGTAFPASPATAPSMPSQGQAQAQGQPAAPPAYPADPHSNALSPVDSVVAVPPGFNHHAVSNGMAPGVPWPGVHAMHLPTAHAAPLNAPHAPYTNPSLSTGYAPPGVPQTYSHSALPAQRPLDAQQHHVQQQAQHQHGLPAPQAPSAGTTASSSASASLAASAHHRSSLVSSMATDSASLPSASAGANNSVHSQAYPHGPRASHSSRTSAGSSVEPSGSAAAAAAAVAPLPSQFGALSMQPNVAYPSASMPGMAMYGANPVTTYSHNHFPLGGGSVAASGEGYAPSGSSASEGASHGRRDGAGRRPSSGARQGEQPAALPTHLVSNDPGIQNLVRYGMLQGPLMGMPAGGAPALPSMQAALGSSMPMQYYQR